MRTPSHEQDSRGNTYPRNVADRLRQQLEQSGRFFRASQVLVGVIFPLCEAILVNFATSESFKEGGNPGTYWTLVIILGCLHVVLFGLLWLVEAPLPQFLVQFDDQAAALERARSRADAYLSDYTTYHTALAASRYSISKIGAMRREKPRTLADAFEEVLYPWIYNRSKIFLFRDGDALYNFAVYLFRKESKELEIEYRFVDDRITRHDRSWRPGDGHVGACYGRRETIFSLYHEDDTGGERQIAETSQPRPQDTIYYNSFAATPLMIGKEPKGVFIVTSSKRDQLVRKLHEPIMGVVGGLLVQALENWVEEEE